MSLVEYNLFGETLDKVQRAIDIVRSFEPPEGYYLADSGGKDSTATKAILRMAGVKFESHYNVTTVDPPELIRFVIRQNEAVIYNLPDGTHKYFIVQDAGKLLLPVSPGAVINRKTIHFSIPKIHHAGTDREETVPAYPPGAVLLREVEGSQRRRSRHRHRCPVGREPAPEEQPGPCYHL